MSLRSICPQTEVTPSSSHDMLMYCGQCILRSLHLGHLLKVSDLSESPQKP